MLIAAVKFVLDLLASSIGMLLILVSGLMLAAVPMFVAKDWTLGNVAVVAGSVLGIVLGFWLHSRPSARIGRWRARISDRDRETGGR